MNGLIAVANAPGVYQAIKAGITSVLNGMMVLPKRIDIPLTDEITNEIRFRFVLNQSEDADVQLGRPIRDRPDGPCRECDHGFLFGNFQHFLNFCLFRLPAGICRVAVIQARNLKDADMIGKSDPYCVVKVGSLERKVSLLFQY